MVNFCMASLVLTNAAQDRRSSLCRKCQSIKLRCLPWRHSPLTDSLPYSLLWSFTSQDLLWAVASLWLLRLSHVSAEHVRYETALGLLGQWNFSHANAEGVRKLFCWYFVQRLSWGELKSLKVNSLKNQISHFINFQESSVKFHVVGLKCQNSNCGGYNTTRTQKRTMTQKPSSSSEPSESNSDDAAPSSSNNQSSVAWP